MSAPRQRPGESALEESAEDLFENAPCGYLTTTPDGTIVRVNATFERWTGHRREQLVGLRRLQDLLSAGGRIYHETHYAPMLRMQGSVREIAVDIVGADRRRLPVLLNSTLIRDEHGAPRLVRTMVFDAAERKSYERELLTARNLERAARERIERLQRMTAALAAAPDAAAVAWAMTRELVDAYAPARAGVAVRVGDGPEVRVLAHHGEPDTAHPGKARFDEGEDGVRPASVRLPLAPGDAWLWLELTEARALTPDERAFLTGCAQQTGLALERSRLYEEARGTALALQRSLLAGATPTDPRFEIATLYEPALAHLEVGGDWYDAFALAGGRLGIVVGDVVGRGLRAASAMGQLRSAVRALAGADPEPVTVLEHLDTFVSQVDAARYATLAYVEVDPATGEATMAAAGHPPPVLIDPSGVPQLLMEGRSAPLGVVGERSPRTQARFALTPGAGFLLYTDGLVERRGEAIDASLERLLAAIRAAGDASPAGLAEELPRALLGGEYGDDDVCLLSFRRVARAEV